jgi:hypothetical protein
MPMSSAADGDERRERADADGDDRREEQAHHPGEHPGEDGIEHVGVDRRIERTETPIEGVEATIDGVEAAIDSVEIDDRLPDSADRLLSTSPDDTHVAIINSENAAQRQPEVRVIENLLGRRRASVELWTLQNVGAFLSGRR